jgi:hypothetical protein
VGGYNPIDVRAKELTRPDGTTYKLGATCTRPAKSRRGQIKLTPGVLEQHFRATLPEHVAGVHTTGPDNFSKFGTVEADWHGPDSTAPEINWRAIKGWYDGLVKRGFHPLLWDSNGAGGYHLDLLLSGPVPTPRLFWFLRELVANHHAYGLPVRPETFPKQSRLLPKPDGRGAYGNWVRLLGRHHTRDVWAKVWSGSEWLADEAAVDFLLALKGDAPDLLPEDDPLPRRIRAYIAKLPHLGEGQGRDDVAYNFAAFLARDLALSDAEALPWLEEWDAGNRPPKGRERLAEILGNAHSYGRNGYGSGLNGAAVSGAPPASSPGWQAPRTTPSVNGTAHPPGDGSCPARPTPAPSILTNYRTETHKGGDGMKETVKHGLPHAQIAADLLALSGDWPKCLDSRLFAVENDAPLWLDSTEALFAWVARQLPAGADNCIRWVQGEDKVNRGEFAAYLRQTVECFSSVEGMPHEPHLPGYYYCHPEPCGGDGAALSRLIDQFEPATPVDRDLIRALFLSVLWGGPPGQCPAWLIESEDDDGKGGRGIGKSKLAQAVAELAGGHVDARPNEDVDKLMTRLLSPAALDRRVVLLDNEKTLRFSWADLVALITADVISGRCLYVGEGRRPNTLLWILTLNQASLSRDMAQRTIPVRLKRPRQDPTREAETWDLIRTERWAIIGDILAELRRPTAPLSRYSRWSAWEQAVLAHVAEPADCQKVIEERQEAIDDDRAEAMVVRDAFVAELKRKGHRPEEEAVWFPSEAVSALVSAATGERYAPRRATSYLRTLGIAELRKCDYEGSRGWAWRGAKASASAPLRDINPAPWAESEESRS